MSFMKSDFTSVDICRIIREAAKAGVEELYLGETRIFFKTNRVEKQVQSISSTETELSAEKTIEQEVIEQQAKQLEQYREKEEKDLNLPLLDPLAWEEAQSQIAREGGEEIDAAYQEIQ